MLVEEPGVEYSVHFEGGEERCPLDNMIGETILVTFCYPLQELNI